MTLPEFLTAALDEDQRVAEAATPGPWRYNSRKQWHSPPPAFGVPAEGEEYVAHGPESGMPGCVAATGPADHQQSMNDARFIAAHDPSRVLAEIAAKRAILDLHTPSHHEPNRWGAPAWDECTGCGGDGKGDWPCETVLVVASTFKDRAGWDASWEVAG